MLRGMTLWVLVAMLLGVGLGPFAVGAIGDHLFHSERMLGPSMALSVVVFCAVSVPIAWFGRHAFRAAVLERDAEDA